MSKGNLFQGQASGKVGDVVMMVRNGQQLSRVYTTSGARSGDSATESSRIQRVKFGGASSQWTLYKYICSRMYRRGKTSTQSDYNYFVKRNAALLPYFDKVENRDSVHCLMPGVMSEGSLGRIDLVHNVTIGADDTPSDARILDANAYFGSNIAYTATMSAFKSRFKVAYPYASKVAFLFSMPRDITISDEGETFVSQQATHHLVSVDLLREQVVGEDALTISQYFAERIDNSYLKRIFTAATGTALGGSRAIMVTTTESEMRQYVENLGILLFATNDLASDCYSTVLDENNVPVTNGAYSVWAGYRTGDALRAAAESYGYQRGVMHDEIANLATDFTQQAKAYVAKLSKLDADAATKYEESIKAAGGVKVRSVSSKENKSE